MNWLKAAGVGRGSQCRGGKALVLRRHDLLAIIVYKPIIANVMAISIPPVRAME